MVDGNKNGKRSRISYTGISLRLYCFSNELAHNSLFSHSVFLHLYQTAQKILCISPLILSILFIKHNVSLWILGFMFAVWHFSYFSFPSLYNCLDLVYHSGSYCNSYVMSIVVTFLSWFCRSIDVVCPFLFESLTI